MFCFVFFLIKENTENVGNKNQIIKETKTGRYK